MNGNPTRRTPMLSVVNARRAAIALLGRHGEVAIAATVLRAQEAKSRGRYEEMASWRSIAEAAFEYTEYNERARRPNAGVRP
jgi:hypothetical protein